MNALIIFYDCQVTPKGYFIKEIGNGRHVFRQPDANTGGSFEEFKSTQRVNINFRGGVA